MIYQLSSGRYRIVIMPTGLCFWKLITERYCEGDSKHKSVEKVAYHHEGRIMWNNSTITDNKAENTESSELPCWMSSVGSKQQSASRKMRRQLYGTRQLDDDKAREEKKERKKERINVILWRGRLLHLCGTPVMDPLCIL